MWSRAPLESRVRSSSTNLPGVAPLPLLDMDEPCQRYAARVVDTPDGLRILGFADRGKADFGGFITDPDPVELGPDGLLRVLPQPRAAE